MKQNPIKIEYDKQSKVLSVTLKSTKSVDSEIEGNVVIDYDKKGSVTKINFYSFSFHDFKEGIPQLKQFAREQCVPLIMKR